MKTSVWWITGGGTGIGRALALEALRQGARVAISGRRLDRLEAVVQEVSSQADGQDPKSIMAIPCDVADPAQCKAAADAVIERWGELTVVVANAGYAATGSMVQTPIEVWKHQFDINLFGLLNTFHAAHPHLVKSGGQIALMGSIASSFPGPGMGPYCSSKIAVQTVAQTLSMELAAEGVGCTLVQPGFVESEIGLVDSEGKFREQWKDKRPHALMWSASRAARPMVRAVRRRRKRVIITGHARLMAALAWALPPLPRWLGTLAWRKKWPRTKDPVDPPTSPV